MRMVKLVLLVLSIASVFSAVSYAEAPDRITGAIEPGQRVPLAKSHHPKAQAQFDEGPVEPSRALQVTMMFVPTAAQQQALNKLLAAQQDPKSASFHKWLTPEQYGERFGLSQSDLGKIKAWLEGQGFKVTYVARGRGYLSFDGNAAQVEGVFQTQIHYFNVNGKMHFANMTPPHIPAALSGIVGAFRGLHDFGPHSMLKEPAYTLTLGTNNYHFLAPGDIATIYDVNPLYQLSPAIDGTGQKVVVVGQSDVYAADLHLFRTDFGLTDISGCTMSSANAGVIAAGPCTSGNFEMVVPTDGSDPGVVSGDVSESSLDIQWVGSVARGAKIIFVTSSKGVDDSAGYAIDQQLAPVISYSYGLCEAFVTAAGINTYETMLQQATGEGISFFAAAGDSGAAECDGDYNGADPAVLGLSVSYPASSPEVTAVGGTEFDEGMGTGPYWGTTNGSSGGSAEKYIPEIAWNDSVPTDSLDATGGGQSNCAYGTSLTSVGGYAFEVCSAPPNGGFAKPSWQTALTPADGVRDVPDIAFSASNVNDVYIVCVPESEIGGTGSTSSCANGINSALTSFTHPSAYGGTSASTPVAAGMTVLLNQYLGASGLGTINQQLYTIYGNNPSPFPFHDVVAGTSTITGGTSDNIVPCTVGDPTFEPLALRCPSGGTMGYSAAVGYDLVSGLGSVDIDALAIAWGGTRSPSSVSVSPSLTKTYQTNTVTLTATVTPSTATGSVTFSYSNGGGSPVTLGTATVTSGVATYPTTMLPVGTNLITATYGGNGTLNSSSNTTTVTILQAFTLAANAGTYTVTPGQTATVNITVNTNQSGFTGNLTYTCTEQSTLTESTCTGPTSAVPYSQGVSFTITTTAATGALRRTFDRQQIFYAALFPGLVGIMFTFGSRKRALGGMRMLGLIMVMGFSTLWLGSCGGNNSSQSNPGTPPGNYTITINAESGSGQVPGATGSVQVTLNVQ